MLDDERGGPVHRCSEVWKGWRRGEKNMADTDYCPGADATALDDHMPLVMRKASAAHSWRHLLLHDTFPERISGRGPGWAEEQLWQFMIHLIQRVILLQEMTRADPNVGLPMAQGRIHQTNVLLPGKTDLEEAEEAREQRGETTISWALSCHSSGLAAWQGACAAPGRPTGTGDYAAATWRTHFQSESGQQRGRRQLL